MKEEEEEEEKEGKGKPSMLVPTSQGRTRNQGWGRCSYGPRTLKGN